MPFLLVSRQTSEFADLDWENLGFGLVQTDYMYIAKCGPDGNFDKGEMVPFGPIEMNPSSGVLNYGQVCMGGRNSLVHVSGRLEQRLEGLNLVVLKFYRF
jgi:branched-chain amino acid aminotransferase